MPQKMLIVAILALVVVPDVREVVVVHVQVVKAVVAVRVLLVQNN